MLPIHEAVSWLRRTDAMSADEKRAKLREMFTECVVENASVSTKASFARVAGKTIGQATDLLPIGALVGGIAHSYMNGDANDIVNKIADALRDPASYAVRNSRSKTSFGYGHHVALGNLSPSESATMLANYVSNQPVQSTNQQEQSMDINQLSGLVCQLSALLAKESSLDGKVTASELETSDARACDAIAMAKGLKAEQADALRSAVAVINMNRSVEERVNIAVSDEVLEMMRGSSSGEPAAAPASSQPAPERILVDGVLARAVDSLLGQATGGKVTSIEAALADLSDLRIRAHELAEQLSRANARPVTVIPTGGSQSVDGSTLTYEVVMVSAADLFKNPKNGKAMAQLKFDVPTLVWKDDTGAVVRHPMIPEPDENYQFRMTHVLKLATAFIMNKNVWAHGHTGTGKTTLFEQFYARLGFPVYRLNLDSNLERSDLVGQTNLAEDNGVTVSRFSEGILPQAMVQPCALILDEIDAGRPDILFTIQRATEGNGLMLTEDGGRLVRPHPLFRFCATANSRGQGDEFGVYAGVRPMNTAMLDRFGVMIEVNYLERDEEANFLAKAYPSLPKTVVTQLTTFAKLIRDAFTNGEISLTLSPRGLKSIAETYSFFDPLLGTGKAMEMAVEMVVIDRATLDNRQRVLELQERAFKA